MCRTALPSPLRDQVPQGVRHQRRYQDHPSVFAAGGGRIGGVVLVVDIAILLPDCPPERVAFPTFTRHPSRGYLRTRRVPRILPVVQMLQCPDRAAVHPSRNPSRPQTSPKCTDVAPRERVALPAAAKKQKDPDVHRMLVRYVAAAQVWSTSAH